VIAEHRSNEDLVSDLRDVIRYAGLQGAALDVLRDVRDRLEARDRDARWGQRVVDVLGHEAVVRGWDRNGEWVFLEFPDSSVPVPLPARDWSPA
jgi:hypothetical protein